ncbi:tRNA(m(1)G37)methyltransferase [Conglomerata obtusa]
MLNYSKTKIFYYVPFVGNKKEILAREKENILQYPKLPHIIDLQKKYPTFSVDLADILFGKADDVLFGKFTNCFDFETDNSEIMYDKFTPSFVDEFTKKLECAFFRTDTASNEETVDENNFITGLNSNGEKTVIGKNFSNVDENSNFHNYCSDENFNEENCYFGKKCNDKYCNIEKKINDEKRFKLNLKEFKYLLGQYYFRNKNFDTILLVKKSELSLKITFNFNYYTAYELLLKFRIPTIASFQVIGHILHLNLTKEHKSYLETIGELFLRKTKNIKTVITKTESINNTFRNFNYLLLAGEDNLTTIHIENNTKFYIDYKNVYWNSKLQAERKNLINSFSAGDTVADVFCGAGPITIQALKAGHVVYCNDLNPVAIFCLKKSVEMNKLHDPFSYNLDAKEFIENLIVKNFVIDHFVMNLPEIGVEYIKYLKSYKNSFILHCYYFCKVDTCPVDKLKSYCWFSNDKSNLRYIRKVSPKKDMWKLTIKINRD